MQVISDVFCESDINFINESCEEFKWQLTGWSSEEMYWFFWFKNLINSPLKNLFEQKISSSINKKIIINEIYQNGQSFGQCGYWHKDNLTNPLNEFTFVYFSKKWLPEYGGHFLIKIDNKVHSVLPEYNIGILFNSSLYHMALSSSRHCPTQRESIACKFRLT